MSQLTLEAKEAIIQQVMNRGDKSIKSIARLNNVGISTVQKWLRKVSPQRSHVVFCKVSVILSLAGSIVCGNNSAGSTSPLRIACA